MSGSLESWRSTWDESLSGSTLCPSQLISPRPPLQQDENADTEDRSNSEKSMTLRTEAGCVMLENQERRSMKSGELSAEGPGPSWLCSSLHLGPGQLSLPQSTTCLLCPSLRGGAGSVIAFGVRAPCCDVSPPGPKATCSCSWMVTRGCLESDSPLSQPNGSLLLCKRETEAGRGKIMAQCQQMCRQLRNSEANPPTFHPLMKERGQFLQVGGTTSGWGGGRARNSLRPAGLGSLETLPR